MTAGRTNRGADERRARYIERRLAGMSMWEAADAEGVGRETMRRYERFFEVEVYGHVLDRPPAARGGAWFRG